jgi:hypothetical protein
MHAIKWLVLLGLAVTNTIQIFFYMRIKKVHRHLPTVKSIITRSELMDFNDAEGKRIYEAKIEFKHEFCEKIYHLDTPGVKSAQLIPAWHYEQELLARYPVG